MYGGLIFYTSKFMVDEYSILVNLFQNYELITNSPRGITMVPKCTRKTRVMPNVKTLSSKP